jgi:diguanylate cyclase (GGDEF)-like protein/PAS domain S-box-containing protein
MKDNAPVQTRELDRLAALESYAILDTPAEQVFDAVVETAAALCDTPIAILGFVVDDRQWFKATRGIGSLRETPREIAFCDHVIRYGGMLEVPDAHLDARFRDSPFVTGEPKLRFYASVPLFTEQGYAIGTLSVADRSPRDLTETQRAALRQLATVVMHLLETRKTERRAARLGEMLDRSQNEIYVFDAASLRFEYVSAGARSNTGYSLAELREMTPTHLQLEVNAQRFQDAIKFLLNGAQTYFDFESECVRKDGSTYPIHARVQLWRDAGHPVFMAVVTDISERRQYEARLRTKHAAMEGAVDGMAILDRRGTYVYMNSAHAKVFGYHDPKELIGRTWKQLYAPGEIERIEREVFPLLARDRNWSGEATALRRDGTTFDEGLSLTLLDDGGLICVCRDITAQKAAEEAVFQEKELAQVTLQSIGDAVITTDVNGRVTYLNPIAEDMTGWPLAEAQGKPLSEVFSVIESATRQPTRNPMQVALAENRIVGLAMDSLLIDRHGKEAAIEDSAAPIHDRAGHVVGGVLIFRDVSETRAMALRMAHLAQHDALTDLPNRVLLLDRMAQAIAAARRHRGKVALLFIDLDHFKQVNDSLGHATADNLLIEVARRLKGCVRESDTVSRQGGDEFVVLLTEVVHADAAARVAGKLLEACTRAFVIEGHQIHIGASIGIAMYPDDGADTDTLVRNADAAMYHAKQQGRNNYQFYAPDMNARAREHLALTTNLRRALALEEFVLHYQPKIDLHDESVVGCEALIRWQDPERGLIVPSEFIPMIEANGLIVPIGRSVLRAVCRQLREWQEAGLDIVPASVNVSAAQFRRTDFYSDVCNALDDAGIEPRYLEIELTESTLTHDLEATAAVLRDLRKLGVRVAIDDFGTGYSSLSQLRRFPIDTLKIDRSFVRDLTTDADDASITAAIVSMAKSLRQEVVAEGVETAEQLNFLRALGCDAAQGYYFYRPLGAPTFAQLLHPEQRSVRAARAVELLRIGGSS